MTQISSIVVYLHCYPDGRPFYVGIGSARRSRKMSDRSEFHLRVQRQLRDQNLEVLIKIDRENLTLEEARNREIELIAAIGRRDLGTGPLVNLNRGGNIVPEKGRQSISKFMKGNTLRTGTKQATSVRQKISASLRKQWANGDYKNRAPRVMKPKP